MNYIKLWCLTRCLHIDLFWVNYELCKLKDKKFHNLLDGIAYECRWNTHKTQIYIDILPCKRKDHYDIKNDRVISIAFVFWSVSCNYQDSWIVNVIFYSLLFITSSFSISWSKKHAKKAFTQQVVGRDNNRQLSIRIQSAKRTVDESLGVSSSLCNGQLWKFNYTSPWARVRE